MKKQYNKEQIKLQAPIDLGGALENTMKLIDPKSENYNHLLNLVGRYAEIENPVKLYEHLAFALKKEKKEDVNISDKILEHYIISKNRIRSAFLLVLDNLEEIQVNGELKLV